MADIRRIAVVGGGLMGAGIAQVFAAQGLDVVVFEPDDDVRQTVQTRVGANLKLVGRDPGLASAIRTTSNLAEAVGQADYVTEAAPEKLELKRAIFADLIKLSAPTAILATNTSVIPITRIADGQATRERIVGTHWWNPPFLIPLVEVIGAPDTSDATLAATMDLLAAAGKSPAHVKKDTPGFVANRLQHALWREAIAMVAEGVCDAATLDACVKSSFGLRLAVLGPLENADLIGLDLTLDIHKTMIPELNRHAQPHGFLESKVAEGKLGFKTGEGFKAWQPEEIAQLQRTLIQHLVEAERGRAG